MKLFHKVENEIRNRFPEIDLLAEVRPEWGSAHDSHRDHIRSVADQHREYSISHARAAGGFVAIRESSGRTPALGFDIEMRARVRPVIIQRILNRSDDIRKDAPQALIWSAKEAAFKALKGSDQPDVITEISLSEFKPISDEIWSFSFAVAPPETQLWKRPPSFGVGYAWNEGDLQFSLCLRLRR